MDGADPAVEPRHAGGHVVSMLGVLRLGSLFRRHQLSPAAAEAARPGCVEKQIAEFIFWDQILTKRHSLSQAVDARCS